MKHTKKGKKKMLEDIKERVEKVDIERKEKGIRQIWVTQATTTMARRCTEAVKKMTGVKVTIPTLIQLAVEDYMTNELGMLTQEEIDEIAEEAARECSSHRG